MKQIKFVDYMEPDKKEIHGGILLDNGDCICGCCGGIFEADERGETWDIVEVYDAWMNLDEEILGDEDVKKAVDELLKPLDDDPNKGWMNPSTGEIFQNHKDYEKAAMRVKKESLNNPIP